MNFSKSFFVVALIALFAFLVANEACGQSSNKRAKNSVSAGSSRKSTRDGSGSRSAGGSDTKDEVSIPELNAEQQQVLSQFDQSLARLKANEREIDRLFRTMPIGFVEEQKKHLARIEELKIANKALNDEVIERAITVVKIAPGRSPRAQQLVTGQIASALAPQGPGQHFNPQLALEISSMLISEDQPNNPSLLMQAFWSSYAVQDFDRSRQVLSKLEEMGTVKSVFYEILEKTAQKWDDEINIRAQEANSDDLPIAIIETSAGTIKVVLFENHAPATVGSFIQLAEKGFYDGRSFFNVRPGEFAETGSPNDDGLPELGYVTVNESSLETARHHFAGTLSMLPTVDGNTGAIFAICHKPLGRLDGLATPFGRIIDQDGLGVAYRLKTFDVSRASNQQLTPSKVISIKIANKRDRDYAAQRPASIATTNPEPEGAEGDDDGAFGLLIDN